MEAPGSLLIKETGRCGQWMALLPASDSSHGCASKRCLQTDYGPECYCGGPTLSREHYQATARLLDDQCLNDLLSKLAAD